MGRSVWLPGGATWTQWGLGAGPGRGRNPDTQPYLPSQETQEQVSASTSGAPLRHQVPHAAPSPRYPPPNIPKISQFSRTPGNSSPAVLSPTLERAHTPPLNSFCGWGTRDGLEALSLTRASLELGKLPFVSLVLGIGAGPAPESGLSGGDRECGLASLGGGAGAATLCPQVLPAASAPTVPWARKSGSARGGRTGPAAPSQRSTAVRGPSTSCQPALVPAVGRGRGAHRG